jgi:PAS domain S-box-containing protein
MTAQPSRSRSVPAAGASPTPAADPVATHASLNPAAGTGLGTWWWDITNNTVAWDEAMYRLFGVPSNAAVGDYQGFIARVHPDDRAILNAIVERAVAAAEDYAATFRIVQSDGELRVIAARGVVYHDASGTPARLIGVCWDATAQRIADEALRTSEARYRGLVESQQDLVFRFDLEERVTFANDAYCAKFGLPREEILGGTLTHLHPDDRAATAATIVRLLAPPHRGMIENRIITPSGWRWISWSGCAIADEHGHIVEIQCVGRDVTERRVAEENLQVSNAELRQSQERLRALAERVVTVREDERRRLGLDLHDGVCQDLIGIALLAGSLRQQAALTTEAVTHIGRIEHHLHAVGEHLRCLAHDLRPMLLHELGLEGSIRALVATLSSEATRAEARFSSAIPRLRDAIEIGVYRIAQEALANAFRHGAPSAVVVTLGVGSVVCLEIRDDGGGFDPTGCRGVHSLGLVSMEERALSLGGTFTLESAPGQGTVVRFECPALSPVPAEHHAAVVSRRGDR